MSYHLQKTNCIVEKSLEVLLRADTHHPGLAISLNCGIDVSNKEFSANNSNSFNFRKANFPLLYQQLLNVDWSFLNELRM